MPELPLVSVIMGVYNCDKTVETAITSILRQKYTNIEFIICNDGSSDGTDSIVQSYAKKFPDIIVYLKNDDNKGLNYTLNRCLSVARGKYIARMDGDDLSLPSRIECEVDFLEKNPQYALVSTWLEVFDDHGVWGKKTFKSEPSLVDLACGSPFSHSACMIRKSIMDEVGGYSEGKKLIRVEDYHLWYKIYAAGYKGWNINEVLYSYRDDRENYKKRKLKYRINSFRIRVEVIKCFGLPKKCYYYAFRPVLIGLLPKGLYVFLHQRKLRQKR